MSDTTAIQDTYLALQRLPYGDLPDTLSDVCRRALSLAHRMAYEDEARAMLAVADDPADVTPAAVHKSLGRLGR